MGNIHFLNGMHSQTLIRAYFVVFHPNLFSQQTIAGTERDLNFFSKKLERQIEGKVFDESSKMNELPLSFHNIYIFCCNTQGRVSRYNNFVTTWQLALN